MLLAAKPEERGPGREKAISRKKRRARLKNRSKTPWGAPSAGRAQGLVPTPYSAEEDASGEKSHLSTIPGRQFQKDSRDRCPTHGGERKRKAITFRSGGGTGPTHHWGRGIGIGGPAEKGGRGTIERIPHK